jgi:hypothetical protein
MTIAGDIERVNQTRPSSAVLHSPDYEQTLEATKQATRLEWPKSYYFFGESLLEDAGGRGLSSQT